LNESYITYTDNNFLLAAPSRFLALFDGWFADLGIEDNGIFVLSLLVIATAIAGGRCGGVLLVEVVVLSARGQQHLLHSNLLHAVRRRIMLRSGIGDEIVLNHAHGGGSSFV